MLVTRSHLLVTCGLATVLAAGCKAPPGGTTNLSCQQTISINPIKTDILLVVDNSCSMTDKQAVLANGLSSFASRLQNAAVQQDFQVGVVTTSVIQQVQGNSSYYVDYSKAGWWGPAQAGRLQQALRSDGTLTPKILAHASPTFLGDLQLAVKVGVIGSGEETEFEPVRLAISPPLITTPLAQGGNQGLLRQGARFFVFAITDEDDCSEMANADGGYDVYIGIDKENVDYCLQQASLLTSPQTYADQFQSLAAAQGSTQQFFAAIAPVDMAPPHQAVLNPAPPPLPAPQIEAVGCPPRLPDGGYPPFVLADGGYGAPYAFGVGRRLREMSYLYDPAGQNLDSICNPSYDNTLVALADSISTPQVLELSAPPPDPAMLLVDVTRADSTVVHCSAGNGFVYSPPSGGLPARVSFVDPCTRKPDDKTIEVKLLCAE